MKKIITLLLAMALILTIVPASLADDSGSTVECATEEEISGYTSLSDIDFSDYDLVMVNYWEPWCPPCKSEMPDLSKLYEEYKDRGVLIVGFYSDTDSFEDAMKEVGEISYPLVNYTDQSEFPDSDGVPTTIFYDSKGNILKPTVEEYYDSIMPQYTAYIEECKTYKDQINETLGKEDLDEDTREYLEEVLEEIDEMINSDTIEEEVMEMAKDYLESFADGYVGSASYDVWKARIESRLPAPAAE